MKWETCHVVGFKRIWHTDCFNAYICPVKGVILKCPEALTKKCLSDSL